LKEKLLKQLQTKTQAALASASAPASPLHTPVVDMTQFAALAEATEDNAFTFVLSVTARSSRAAAGYLTQEQPAVQLFGRKTALMLLRAQFKLLPLVNRSK